ncbi:LuxR C-terminal-related transcriptional regulator [Arthrobacter sp. CAN_A1]|uniref:LuxR C-terminal-related transcriptional regulator n=1 Tax=Arthrobacter sp. CAN_A1 TaxID=2787717 RepID=UPI0018C9AF2B
MAPHHGVAGLVGRTSNTRAIIDSILDPAAGGAMVCGAPGVGKSAVADAVLLHLQGRVVPVTIYADASLKEVPYGALGPVFREHLPAHLDSPLSVLRTIRSALRSLAADAPFPVLVVLRDAHHLDQDSSHLFGQLALAREIRLLVLSTDAGTQPEALNALCRDGLLTRFELAPLIRDQIGELCRQDLGGLPSSGCITFVSDWSRGNPYLAKALIAHLRTSGALIEQNGVWLMVCAPDSAGDVLASQVKPILMGCSPAGRRAVEVVAMLGCIPTAAARLLLDAVGLEEALQARILSYSRHHGQDRSCLTIEPKVYGEAVRDLVPPGRRAEILAWLRESPGGRELLHDAGVINRVAWELSLGYPIADGELVATARLANDGYSPRLARQLAAAVTSPDFTTAARVEAARSLLDAGDTDAAAAEIRGTMDAAADPQTLSSAALTEARIALQRGRGPEGLMEISDRWTVIAQGLQQHAKQASQGATILHCAALSLAGDYAAAIDGLQRVLGDTPVPSRDTLVAQLVLGEALGATGCTAAANDLTQRAVAETAPGRMLAGHYRTVIARRAALLVQTRDETGFIGLVRWHEQHAPRPLHYFGGEMTSLEGVMDVRCGRITRGCALMTAGIEELQRSDPELLLPLVLGAAAFANQLVGNHERATAYVADYRRLQHRGTLPQRLVSDAYIAAAQSWPEVSPDNSLAVLAQADTARAFSLVHAEAEVLELLFLMKYPLPAERFNDLAGRLGAAHADVVHLMAEVSVSHDPALLMAAGARAIDARRQLLGAECLARAAAVYGAHGEARAQRAVLQQVRELRPTLGGIRTGAISDAAMEQVVLTQRELEIARLAARGASSSQIATSLTVSRRTVEGHLYRIYLKLGISGREELSRGLSAAGVPE